MHKLTTFSKFILAILFSFSIGEGLHWAVPFVKFHSIKERNQTHCPELNLVLDYCYPQQKKKVYYYLQKIPYSLDEVVSANTKTEPIFQIPFITIKNIQDTHYSKVLAPVFLHEFYHSQHVDQTKNYTQYQRYEMELEADVYMGLSMAYLYNQEKDLTLKENLKEAYELLILLRLSDLDPINQSHEVLIDIFKNNFNNIQFDINTRTQYLIKKYKLSGQSFNQENWHDTKFIKIQLQDRVHLFNENLSQLKFQYVDFYYIYYFSNLYSQLKFFDG